LNSKLQRNKGLVLQCKKETCNESVVGGVASITFGTIPYKWGPHLLMAKALRILLREAVLKVNCRELSRGKGV